MVAANASEEKPELGSEKHVRRTASAPIHLPPARRTVRVAAHRSHTDECDHRFTKQADSLSAVWSEAWISRWLGLMFREEYVMGSGMKYTPEFRAAAVAEVLNTSRPIKDVAAELSIKADTLRGWIYRSEKAGEVAKKLDETSLEAQVKVLRAQLREVEDENRFLKKAAAFFASDQHNKNGSR